MRIVVPCLVACMSLSVVASAGAQKKAPAPPEPTLSALSPEAQTALDDLSSRFATEVELHPGWFRDRPMSYYDFGAIPRPVAAGRVYWPIHGFDAQGNPVAIRNQRPIFSTIPGLPDYSGVWNLVYVVTADHSQPNALRDVAAVEALVRGRRALLKDANTVLNLAIVARGSHLAQDSTPATPAWYAGRDVEFFDFGPASLAPVSLMVLERGQDAQGAPMIVRDQANIADTIPVAAPFPDLWNIQLVTVDSAYQANTLKSAGAVKSGGFLVQPANTVRNCPVAFVDGKKIDRAASPVRTFADLRAPMPPAPTILKVP